MDYRNEIGVILINLGKETVWIEDGERIAQFVLNKVEQRNIAQLCRYDLY